MEIKRGDVFYLKYDDSVGRELATGRVVLSNTQEILRNDCVVVALLTNTPRSGNVQVSLNDHITYVNVGQIRTVDKYRLHTYKGTLTKAEMQKISGKLQYILSLAGNADHVSVNESRISTDWNDATEDVDNHLYKDLYEKARNRCRITDISEKCIWIGIQAGVRLKK